MIRPEVRRLIFVLICMVTVQQLAISQPDRAEERTEQDRLVMQEGTRLTGNILRQTQERIVFEMADPNSRMAIPLKDIYSMNGLTMDLFRRMQSYLEKTEERIEELFNASFVTDPQLRMANPSGFGKNSGTGSAFPSAGSVPTELQMYSELGILSREVDKEIDSILKRLHGKIQIHAHADQAHLLVLPRSRAISTGADGGLTYLDRYRISHLVAHLFLRQHGSKDEGTKPRGVAGSSTENELATAGIREGLANYIALWCIQNEMGLGEKEPLPLHALLDPGAHFSSSGWKTLPPFLRQRYTRLLREGLRFAWLGRRFGNDNRWVERYGQHVESTRAIAEPERFFSGHLTDYRFKSPNDTPSMSDPWSVSYRGALGYHTVSWIVDRLAYGQSEDDDWLAGYRTDLLWGLSSKADDRKLVGWVTEWANTEDARSFYRAVRRTLDERPWPLEPGWQGGKHQFYQRGGRRVSVDRRDERVFVLIAPSADTHNVMLERLTALNVDSRDMNSSFKVSEKRVREASNKYDSLTEVWAPVQPGNAGLQFEHPRVQLSNPFLQFHVPSFWSVKTEPAKDAELVGLEYGEQSTNEIQVRALRMKQSINNALLSLLRYRELQREGGVRSVRRLPLSGNTSSASKSGGGIVGTYRYSLLTGDGSGKFVRERAFRSDRTVFLFQLITSERPGSYMTRTFQKFLRGVSVSNDN